VVGGLPDVVAIQEGKVIQSIMCITFLKAAVRSFFGVKKDPKYMCESQFSTTLSACCSSNSKR